MTALRFTVHGLPAVTRFWAKVATAGDDECWEWQAARDRAGYGAFWFAGTTGRAARFSWELANNRRVPPGLVVRHSCDNPPCVNPAHLLIGTTRDNDNDRVARGRSATGDRNGSRLHPERLKRGPEHPQWLPGGCKKGHPAERRYTNARGERICTDCATERALRYRAKKRASA